MTAVKNVAAQSVTFAEVVAVQAELIAKDAAPAMPGAWENMMLPPAPTVLAAQIDEQIIALQAMRPAAAPTGPTVEQQIAIAVARAEKALTDKLAAGLAAANAAAANAQAYASKIAQEAAAAHAAKVQPNAASADMAAIEKLMNNPPSGVRVLVGFILAIMSSFTVGYGIGCLLAYALAGITTLVGAGLAAFMLSTISWIIAIYAAWKVGGWVGGKVFSSVVMPDGLASTSIDAVSNTFSSARSTVGGWFTAKPVAAPVAPAAPFTGAHRAAA